ncbi:MAG: cytochrome c oxidase accessory protein CcoG [Pseudomonadota bacterium]
MDGEARMSIDAAVSGSDAASDIASFDVSPVNSAEARKLYKAREPIYPKRVSGLYRRVKWLLLAAMLAFYYLAPWIRWPRGPAEPDQAILVDFAGRRFYFFFIEIWPDELYYVTGLLILAALGLFLATALFGRVWCGYACPQTIWTDLYIAVERWIEGDRNQRMKLAKAPMSADKIRKKVSKHVIWILIAAATGGAWVFYFHDAPTILPQLFRGEAPGSAYLFMGVLTFTTYALAGTMREQVCTYMCPWPRIQAALTDAETLQVTYKTDRGEPRGAHKKGESWEGRGDCIGCKACVAACPMGIDIREGPQLECINCALCIDACDDIMARIDRPKRLIGYDTDLNLERRVAGQKPQSRFVRSRTLFYAAAFAIVSGVMIFAMSTRATIEANVLRDRTPPFVKLSDGSIRNGYTVKLTNKENFARTFSVSFAGVDGLELTSVGLESADASFTAVVEGDDSRSLRILADLPSDRLTASSLPLTIVVSVVGETETARRDTVFLTGWLR